MSGIDKIVDGIKTCRDEIALKVHLGSKDLQDEWAGLEKKWRTFESKADLERSAGGVSTAAQLLANELKDGYDRLRKAL